MSLEKRIKVSLCLCARANCIDHMSSSISTLVDRIFIFLYLFFLECKSIENSLSCSWVFLSFIFDGRKRESESEKNSAFEFTRRGEWNVLNFIFALFSSWVFLVNPPFDGLSSSLCLGEESLCDLCVCVCVCVCADACGCACGQGQSGERKKWLHIEAA